MEQHNILSCAQCPVISKSIFCNLATQNIELLNNKKHKSSFKKGDFIFHEGSHPKYLFCVASGKVKLIQLGKEGKEQIIHMAGSGDVMGYRAILSNDKYSCSAIAMDDTVLCTIPRKDFISLVEKSPEVALQVIHLFSKELKEAEKKITTIAQRPIKERIAQSLLLLKEHYGFENDGCTINITITREEIANYTGTTRETAIRTLTELSKEHIIELVGKKIKILSAEGLIKAANIFV